MPVRVSFLFLLPALCAASPSAAQEQARPNILWITSEDNGPQLGCYGDEYADTPHIDRLAARGVIYLNCWSTAPVCAPARTALISGMYPPSTGSEHMRSMTRLPDGFLMYPQYLRQAGYYCTNNAKEDYNLEKPGQVWDESSRQAHWRHRQPGQPFFAVFNIETTHEGQIRRRPHTAVHDPARVRVPRYHPDTPEVRQDWAQYYDKITEMDRQVGRYLQEIEEAGLRDETIVFYFGDHGAGMPRSKRWPYNSGLRAPLVLHIPERFRHLRPADYPPQGRSERLVGFVDFAPTLLSLAGIQPPAHFQGHAFLGPHAAAAQPYLFGFRGRMDERYDMVRVVRDQRYIFIRNYMPHKIYGQHVAYMFETPTTRVWKQLYDEGKLEPPRTYFWERKPPIELYDLAHDPDEVRNLADSPEHQEVVERLSRAQREWSLRIGDLGFLPEAEIHQRAEGSTPYEVGHDPTRYPLERLLGVAEQASSLRENELPALERALGDSDSAVRYWAALGLLIQAEKGMRVGRDNLRAALGDSSWSVRVIAAEALGRFGTEADRLAALEVLVPAADLRQHDLYIAMLALNALDALDQLASPVRDRIAALPRAGEGISSRMSEYVGKLIDKTLADLR
jgi:uncharacterized sulfatase